MDAALTVHLFDTMDSWDVAYLLSGDADFVPAVRSLRRRGKIVIGVGFADASSALVRECYEYIDLSKVFLPTDVAAFALFKEDGIIKQWFSEPVCLAPDYKPVEAELSLKWSARREMTEADRQKQSVSTISPNSDWIYTTTSPTGPICEYVMHLSARGWIDFSTRKQLIETLQVRFPDLPILLDDDTSAQIPEMSTLMCEIKFPPTIWSKIEKTLHMLMSSIPNLVNYSNSYLLTIPESELVVSPEAG